MGRFLRGGFLPLLCLLAGLAAGDLPAADAERFRALARERLGVERCSLCELRLPEEAQVPPAAFRVEVELGGRPSTIRLERHFVRGAGFRLLVQGADGEIREAEPPMPRTYRGVVEGSPGSRVAASLLPQGLSAHVVEAEGSAWIVRPLRLLDGAGSRESHVVYSPEDVEPFSCGTRADGPAPDEVEVIEPAREAGALKDRGSGADTKGSCLLKVADIAFDSDHEFYDDQGRDEALCVAIIEDGLNITNLIYTRDVKITHRLSAIVLRTDPATDFYAQFPDGSDFGAMLVAFREEWNDNMQHIERDVAYLLTGKSRPEYGGLAYVRVVCSSWHYGMGIGGPGYEGIFRHEVGHNWGAGHSCGTERRYIMCGNAISAISAYNIRVMSEFSDSVGCLDEEEHEADPAPPYARLDRVLAVQGEGPIALAVLEGDTDINCDPLHLVRHDARSSFGAKVQVLDPADPDGRESLLYMPRSGFTGTDFFSYTVSDSAGYEVEGRVLVEVSPRALILYLPLDETEGTAAADAIGSGLEGELRGDLAFDLHSVEGRFGRALGFRGVDGEYLSLGDDSAFDLRSGITVATWFRVDGFSGDGETIVGKGSSAWRLKRDGTRSALRFTCDGLTVAGAAGGDVAGDVLVDDGEWHHAAGVYDGSRICLYIDGELDASLPASGKIQTSSSSVHVGDELWNGPIDEVRIYNHGLTAGEIRTLYRSGRIETPQPPDGAGGVLPGETLSWIAAPSALAHDFYLGADCAAVKDATPSSPEYAGRLAQPSVRPAIEPGEVYFWRVDEVVDGEPRRGDVRSFSTSSFFSAFDEPDLSSAAFAPEAGHGELGFHTASTPSGGESPFAGVIETGSTPTSPVFSHRSVIATTTFDPVDLARIGESAVSLILQARDTGYEPDDYVDVRVERGGESVRLLRLEGEAALTQRAGAGYARLVAALPPQWETATLSISSSSDSSAGSERFDFDSIAFFPIESSRTIGYTDFREPAVGASSYAPPADGRELGFATVSTPTGGALLEVGVAEHDAPLRPRRLVHRSVAATTTFETVDLSGEADAIARVVLRVLDTGYESDDYLRVHVTDGTEQVDILDASGDGGLGGLAGGEYMSYEAVIPSDWRRATLVISSSSDSSSGAEGFDIRCVEIVTRPAPSCEAAPAGIRFRRGDSNSDGDLDLSDGIRILGYLFLGGSGISCLDAADTDDSGAIDISDGVRIFNYLFLGGAPPAAPGHLDCGIDPTADALTCDVYSPCE